MTGRDPGSVAYCPMPLTASLASTRSHSLDSVCTLPFFALPAQATNQDVYNVVAAPLISPALSGISGTVRGVQGCGLLPRGGQQTGDPCWRNTLVAVRGAGSQPGHMRLRPVPAPCPVAACAWWQPAAHAPAPPSCHLSCHSTHRRSTQKMHAHTQAPVSCHAMAPPFVLVQVFAYGVTSSGKTHTMMGGQGAGGGCRGWGCTVEGQGHVCGAGAVGQCCRGEEWSRSW